MSKAQFKIDDPFDSLEKGYDFVPLSEPYKAELRERIQNKLDEINERENDKEATNG